MQSSNRLRRLSTLLKFCSSHSHSHSNYNSNSNSKTSNTKASQIVNSNRSNLKLPRHLKLSVHWMIDDQKIIVWHCISLVVGNQSGLGEQGRKSNNKDVICMRAERKRCWRKKYNLESTLANSELLSMYMPKYKQMLL
jgi:hypothetical protein